MYSGNRNITGWQIILHHHKQDKINQNKQVRNNANAYKKEYKRRN